MDEIDGMEWNWRNSRDTPGIYLSIYLYPRHDRSVASLCLSACFVCLVCLDSWSHTSRVFCFVFEFVSRWVQQALLMPCSLPSTLCWFLVSGFFFSMWWHACFFWLWLHTTLLLFSFFFFCWSYHITITLLRCAACCAKWSIRLVLPRSGADLSLCLLLMLYADFYELLSFTLSASGTCL